MQIYFIGTDQFPRRRTQWSKILNTRRCENPFLFNPVNLDL